MEFSTRADVWEEFVFPIGDFEASFRGRILNDYPPLQGENVVTVGFLLADKKPGAFRLEVATVKAVMAAEP